MRAAMIARNKVEREITDLSLLQLKLNLPQIDHVVARLYKVLLNPICVLISPLS